MKTFETVNGFQMVPRGLIVVSITTEMEEEKNTALLVSGSFPLFYFTGRSGKIEKIKISSCTISQSVILYLS